jgi:hypothetical protein
MRIGVVVILSLGLGAGSVLAQGAPPATAPKAEVKSVKARAKENIAECVRMWDAGTHTTPPHWARTCERIHSRLESLSIEHLEPLGTALRKKKG